MKRTLILSLLLISCSSTPKPTMDTPPPQNAELATFAGGCFWCMEQPFEVIDGVHSVVSGYAGGEEVDPSYEQVASGGTGHLEAVQITFNPAEISYDELLTVFWQQIDPTDAGGQFVDRGRQYSTAVFYHSDSQKTQAEASKAVLQESGVFTDDIVTPILPFASFFPAEDYHQNYYKENPIRYGYYRGGSGRDDFLKSTWNGQKSCPFKVGGCERWKKN